MGRHHVIVRRDIQPSNVGDELAVLSDDLGEALDEYRATGRGRSKAIRIAKRIQCEAAELARKLGGAS